MKQNSKRLLRLPAIAARERRRYWGLHRNRFAPIVIGQGSGAWQVHGLQVPAREPRFADKCGDVPIEMTAAGNVFPIRGQSILPATHAFVRRAAVLAEQVIFPTLVLSACRTLRQVPIPIS